MKPILPFAAALLFAAALPVHAQPAQTQITPAPKAADFVKQAAMTNLFEIDAAEAAESKHIGEAYKAYARMVEQDHKRMQSELQAMVEKPKALSTPTSLDPAHQQLLKQLQTLDGASFEQNYRSGQIDGHRKAIQLFKNYGRAGDEPELKRWAKDDEPVLQKHLAAAERLPPPTTKTQ